jgi:hypothetical protein
MATDYKWLAESICMAGAQITSDLLAAIDHARDVPGNITPGQADRLINLGLHIHAVLDPVKP